MRSDCAPGSPQDCLSRAKGKVLLARQALPDGIGKTFKTNIRLWYNGNVRLRKPYGRQLNGYSCAASRGVPRYRAGTTVK